MADLPTVDEIAKIMRFLGSRKSAAKTKAARENARKPRKSRKTNPA